jgi:hypothetical protein
MGQKDCNRLCRCALIAESNGGRSEQGRVTMTISLVNPRASIEQFQYGLPLARGPGYHQSGPAGFIRSIHVFAPLQLSLNLSSLAQAGSLH